MNLQVSHRDRPTLRDLSLPGRCRLGYLPYCRGHTSSYPHVWVPIQLEYEISSIYLNMMLVIFRPPYYPWPGPPRPKTERLLARCLAFLQLSARAFDLKGARYTREIYSTLVVQGRQGGVIYRSPESALLVLLSFLSLHSQTYLIAALPHQAVNLLYLQNSPEPTSYLRTCRSLPGSSSGRPTLGKLGGPSCRTPTGELYVFCLPYLVLVKNFELCVLWWLENRLLFFFLKVLGPSGSSGFSAAGDASSAGFRSQSLGACPRFLAMALRQAMETLPSKARFQP